MTQFECAEDQVCNANSESDKCITCSDGCLDGQCQGCEIGSGPCCDDNGQIKAETEVCDQGTDFQCSGTGCGDDVQKQAWTKYCDGVTNLCEGSKIPEDWELDTDCESEALCQEQTDDKPICAPCSYVCHEGVCKDCVPNSNACCDSQGVFILSASACGDPTDTECSDPDTCDGAGTCLFNHGPSGAPCEDQGIVCLENDTCDGSGQFTNNGYSPLGAPCGDQTDTDCNKPNTCNGKPDPVRYRLPLFCWYEKKFCMYWRH